LRGVIVTWLIAEGIISYRAVKVNHAPPMPGMLLATSGLFVMLALLAESGPDAAKLATLLGAGFDIAGFMHLFGLGGPAAAAGAGTPTTTPAKAAAT
jgi:hypothetical protein